MGKLSVIRMVALGVMVFAGGQAAAGVCKELTDAYNVANPPASGTSKIVESAKTNSLVTKLAAALKDVVTRANASTTNKGFKNPVWATLVNADGIVCAVTVASATAAAGDATAPLSRTKAWAASRVISAQKAHTAASVSTDHMAFSTANLYAASQPGGPFYGIEGTNPVNTTAAYAGPTTKYGLYNDPMVGKRVGGINVFGGGLALYGKATSTGTVKLLGGLGVSGDTSCTDHFIAWMARDTLNLDPASAYVNGATDGVSGGTFVTGNTLAYSLPNASTNGTSASAVWDNIIYDITDIVSNGSLATKKVGGDGSSYFSAHGISTSGYGHPLCRGTESN